ncbi:hypothetical protein Tco_1267024, partial [Tanacetum coccineum]
LESTLERKGQNLPLERKGQNLPLERKGLYTLLLHQLSGQCGKGRILLLLVWKENGYKKAGALFFNGRVEEAQWNKVALDVMWPGRGNFILLNGEDWIVT